MRYSLFILCLVAADLSGQGLVRPGELEYDSKEELDAIESYLRGEPDLFALFTLTGKGTEPSRLEEYRMRYREGLRNIRYEKLVGKKPGVRIDRIYKSIHGDFFTQYEEHNYFGRIFETGRYNCVSATAFYGLIFADLGIPFTVRENPTHVYLVAYPEEEKILVETTAPGLGTAMYPENFKKEFIDKLVENKLIPPEELHNMDVNSLFDRFYFNDEDVNLVQLVGIQYMNDAIYRAEEKDYPGAWNQAGKAWLFYPGQKSAYLMMNAGMAILNEGDYYTDPEMTRIYIALSRFGEWGITDDMILGEFRKVMDDVLIERNDIRKMEEIYARILSGIETPELRSELNFAYNYERGRLLYNLARYREALTFIEQANRVKPSHQHAQGLLSAAILHVADTDPDPLNRSQFLEEKVSLFPGLAASAGIASLTAASYLEECTRNFKTNDPEQGNRWLDRFEEFRGKSVELNISTATITDAYSAAAVYYFRRGNKTMARKLLQRGLVVSPGNFELEQRLKAVR